MKFNIIQLVRRFFISGLLLGSLNRAIGQTVSFFKIGIVYLFSITLFANALFGQNYQSHKVEKDHVSIQTADGKLNIIPLQNNTIRIKVEKNGLKESNELIFQNLNPFSGFQCSEDADLLLVKTNEVTVSYNKQTGALSFADKTGKSFLNEKAGCRKLKEGSISGETCLEAEQSFESPEDETLFGLGQFQDGAYNLRNVTRRLTQVNSQIAIPFIYSGKGYGLLWHQYGLTDFNPTDNFISLEKQTTTTGNGQMAEVTTTSGTQKVSQDQSVYTGKFTVSENGEYSIFLDLGDMGNRHFVTIDGKPCLDQSNMWLPPTAGTLLKLTTGEHQVQIICKSNNTPKLSWKKSGNSTTFRSPHTKGIDYVVFYGPSADKVISSYRKLSGDVPMFPKWAYGFWQCRERYTSGKHLVETVQEFRKRQIPMDVIVQDWQYWGNQGWGVPVFDTTNYKNPAGFIKELHDLNAHFNVSIWSNPDRNSNLGKEFISKNLYIANNSKWLDYFNPATRETYWNTLNQNMFAKGVDSWWMDAVEPENDALHNEKTSAGLGDFYRLTYPYMVSKSVYEGQRKTSSDKRVCILTRSAFSGQQRYGIINWSGDIGGNWDTYKRQIVAGLNYTITGFAYWTTDIGGFFRPGWGQYTDEKFHELLLRWYQWGTFNPIMRIHGYMTETEPWKYGQKVEDGMKKMLNLRYSLLPYIYSEAWQVTKSGSTLMRPMVMDFIGDTAAVNQKYQFMFGKSILVAPVTEEGVNQWNVYLPQTADWYDFWTGNKIKGGQTVRKETPLDILPLYVKAGSILPFGPQVQYASEKKWDDLEIRIFEGADGEFSLYEDENDNYNYEKGIYSTITFAWDDAKKTLSISDRKGSFPGMITERNFRIVRVAKNKGKGMDNIEKYDEVIVYKGKKVITKFK
jgi:alpha-D-xyloside xylohydrolase